MRNIFAFIVCFNLLLSPITAAAVEYPSFIDVYCDSRVGRASHRASGSFNGITENIPEDLNSLVVPLHPFVMRNPARSGEGNQYSFGDAIKVAKRLSSVQGALVLINLSDLLPGSPYKFPGFEQWESQIKSFLNDKKGSGVSNWYGIEIWNEPDLTWDYEANGMHFDEFWQRTYQVIRQNDRDVKIIGPCFSSFDVGKIQAFLEYCKLKKCLPNLMCWHELQGSGGVSLHLQYYHNIELTVGINAIPICISEYRDPREGKEGQPGISAPFIAKFERHQADCAIISFGPESKQGRLGGLLASDTEKGAGWYFYNWYGEMSGEMISVRPPIDYSAKLDGAACADYNKKYISFIFGGPNKGAINVDFSNIPSFIGTIANVKAEKIEWKSQDTPSKGPSTIFENKFNLDNRRLTVLLNDTDDSSGYRILITRADGSSDVTPGEGEQHRGGAISDGVYKLINRNSGKALTVSGDSTADSANVVQNSDSGRNSQKWKVTFDGDGYSIINVNANKALDVANSSIENGGNIIIYPDQGGRNQRWTVKKSSDDYYFITNLNSGKAVDVENASQGEGGNVVQWDNNGGNNQQWRFTPA